VSVSCVCAVLSSCFFLHFTPLYWLLSFIFILLYARHIVEEIILDYRFSMELLGLVRSVEMVKWLAPRLLLMSAMGGSLKF
jgi:hypothetical protein